MQRLPLFVLVFALSAACTGQIGTPSVSEENLPPLIGNPRPTMPSEYVLAPSGIRRLTQWEYANTVSDLLGFEPARVFETLPTEGRTPFDNNAADQAPTDTLIAAAERLATDLAAEFIRDEEARQALVPCAPSGAGDSTCFRAFVEAFTLNAFRRPVEAEEVERFVALQSFGVERDDFYVGVETVIMAVLQDPRFLYRLETGTPSAADPQVLLLDTYALASRLSYLLWGSGPNPWLLEQVAAGALDTPDGLARVAELMFDEPASLTQAARYHSMWLDFESIGGDPDLAGLLRTETNALVERVVRDDLPWTSILTLDEAYVNQALAAHYDIEAPSGGGFAWVSLDGSGRAGLLSQGAFLTGEANAVETNPTRRGAEIRTRLFCQVVELPPNTDVDVPPNVMEAREGACTPERLAAHASGGCAGCHSLTDPIGFGLQQYDMSGRPRSHESNRPDCPIDGEGAVGSQSFNGSAELGEVLSSTDAVQRCFVRQAIRFASGRAERSDSDVVLATDLSESLGASMTYRQALLAIATHPSFTRRRLEPTTETEGR